MGSASVPQEPQQPISPLEALDNVAECGFPAGVNLAEADYCVLAGIMFIKPAFRYFHFTCSALRRIQSMQCFTIVSNVQSRFLAVNLLPKSSIHSATSSHVPRVSNSALADFVALGK